MKLYLGLKESEYLPFDRATASVYKKGWRQLLTMRERGDFKYPESLNPIIMHLAAIEPLVLRQFTDQKERAEAYARTHGGAVVCIDVPLDDVLKYFIIEFKNYRQRRKSYEITYSVKGSDLTDHASEWATYVTNP